MTPLVVLTMEDHGLGILTDSRTGNVAVQGPIATDSGTLKNGDLGKPRTTDSQVHGRPQATHSGAGGIDLKRVQDSEPGRISFGRTRDTTSNGFCTCKHLPRETTEDNKQRILQLEA